MDKAVYSRILVCQFIKVKWKFTIENVVNDWKFAKILKRTIWIQKDSFLSEVAELKKTEFEFQINMRE